jgi:hypothetical protein
MVPSVVKHPRVDPIAAARNRQKSANGDIEMVGVKGSDDMGCYESFNEGFGTSDKPIQWGGRSKRPRRKNTFRGASKQATSPDDVDSDLSDDGDCSDDGDGLAGGGFADVSAGGCMIQ